MFDFIHCFWEFFWSPSKVFTYVFFELFFGAFVFVWFSLFLINMCVQSLGHMTPWRLQPRRLLCARDILARILEHVAISSSRGSSQPKDRTHVSYESCIVGWFFTTDTTWEAHWDPCIHRNPILLHHGMSGYYLIFILISDPADLITHSQTHAYLTLL